MEHSKFLFWIGSTTFFFNIVKKKSLSVSYLGMWKSKILSGDVVMGLLNALPSLFNEEIIQFPGNISKLGGQQLV